MSNDAEIVSLFVLFSPDRRVKVSEPSMFPLVKVKASQLASTLRTTWIGPGMHVIPWQHDSIEHVVRLRFTLFPFCTQVPPMVMLQVK